MVLTGYSQDHKTALSVSTNYYNIKKTAYIFYVTNISLLNILHNVQIFSGKKNLSIGRDRTDKVVKTQVRLLFEEQSDQGLHFFSFCLEILTLLKWCLDLQLTFNFSLAFQTF